MDCNSFVRKIHSSVKHIILCTIILLTAFFCTSQRAITFEQAKILGLGPLQLDSIYAPGAHADSTLAVFGTRQDAYIRAYQGMLQDLGDFLKKNGFVFDKPTKGFNKIYFNMDGYVDHFLFSFRPDQLTAEQESEFHRLLEEFLKTYQFPMQAEKSFSQCSPVTYQPPAK